MRRLGSQMLVGTSTIFMANPHALIYEFGESGIRAVEYEETEHFQLTRVSLLNRNAYLRRLFQDD